MRKIVINKCYGGFGLSDEALALLQESTGARIINEYDLKRDDSLLVKVVEELGEKANGVFADLAIVEIPEDVEWCVEEYYGMEWVAEKHRVWIP